MKRPYKTLLSLLLCVSILATVIPVPLAFADEGEYEFSEVFDITVIGTSTVQHLNLYNNRV
jgi:hypothetical protein